MRIILLLRRCNHRIITTKALRKEILAGEKSFTFSSSWIYEKYTPNKIVIIRDWDALEKIPSIRAWCAHVTLTPEDRRIIVFIKGTVQELNASTPIGGQEQPNSMLGERLLWKARRKRKISLPKWRKALYLIEVLPLYPCANPSTNFPVQHPAILEV